ncbi:MAG: hypothetical protein ACR2HG_02045 [Pyrinomonadaceae bacterium]
MKKISLVTFLLSIMFAAAYAQPATKNAAPSITFNRLWVDYDVKEDSVNGMRIHADFKAYGMKGVDSYLAVYFQKRDGTSLMDKNGSFNSEDGKVAVFKAMKPGYEPTVYEDLSVFMPYAELDLSGGDYALRMDVDVIYENGDLIQHLTFYNFDFTQPGKTTTKTVSSTPSAKFNRVWADYDVTEKNQYGMRIHLDFSVYNMKGMDGYAAIYFQKRDGTKILTNNRDYRSKEGQVAVFREIKPGYDPTDYKDLTLFLPYSELSLTKGSYQLTMDIDVIKEDGTLVQHLNLYDFDYDKP